jgi:hypothetical protein
MPSRRAPFYLPLTLRFLCGVALAQQSSTAVRINDLGAENSSMAQRAGLWDVTETTWDSPVAAPTVKKLVAERRMIGSFLEEVLEPAPNSSAADIKRIDYLSFNRVEGRWKYVSMDMRAPVGLMPAASVDRGDDGTIRLIFEPLSLLRFNQRDVALDLPCDRKAVHHPGGDEDRGLRGDIPKPALHLTGHNAG